MKRLVTQFDDTRLRSTVATPTCSSCCCCCCCLATVITSSSLLAQRINREAKVKNTSDRVGLTLLAALFVPVVGLITYLLFTIFNQLFNRCSPEQFNANVYYDTLSSTCSSPQYVLLLPLSICSMLFVLWYLYVRVGIQHPFKRSVLIATLIGIAFTVEFFGGAALILSGAGGVFYLFLVPVIFVLVSVKYNKRLREKSTLDPVYQGPVAPNMQDIPAPSNGTTSTSSSAPQPPSDDAEPHDG